MVGTLRAPDPFTHYKRRGTKFVLPEGISLNNRRISLGTGPRGMSISVEADALLAPEISAGPKEIKLHVPGLNSVAALSGASLRFGYGSNALDDHGYWIVQAFQVSATRVNH